MHSVHKDQLVTIHTIRVAVAADTPEGEVADEMSALLTENGVANSESAVLDWMYVFDEERTVKTPANKSLCECGVFLLDSTYIPDPEDFPLDDS